MTSLGERNKDGLSASPKISGRWLSSWRFFSNGLDQPPTRLVISHILLTWVCFWMPPGHPKARLVMMKFTEKTGLKYLKLLFTNRYPKWNLILEATEASSKKPSIILLVSVGSIWSRGREFFKKKSSPLDLRQLFKDLLGEISYTWNENLSSTLLHCWRCNMFIFQGVLVFVCWMMFYGFDPGINRHLAPPLGKICLELFPSIEQANLSHTYPHMPHVYIHIYIYIFMHIYIHMHIPSDPSKSTCTRGVFQPLVFGTAGPWCRRIPLIPEA